MNVLLRVLAILALAVALTIAVKYNAGYVVLFYPPYRVELSLGFLVVMLLIVFFLAYGLLRLGAHTLNLPAEVHAFKQERQREKARTTMRESVSAFAAGHYAKAEKLAVNAMEQGEAVEINALIAARSAHAIGAHDRRDTYLTQMGKTCSDYPDTGMKEVFIHQDPETGDVILSRKPTTWDDFFAALKGVDVPADFLDKKERDQGAQDRDPFEGGSE